MSTSPEDTAPTKTPSSTESPSATEEAPEASASTGASPAADEAFLAGRPAPNRSTLFGPETFSIAGLLMLVTTLLSTQLIRIFNQQTLTGSYGALTLEVRGELIGAGLLSALAVVFAAVALVRSGSSTRQWARQLAAATVLVGVLLALMTVLSYLLLA
ncbi:hypothetical protein [Nocardiopsis ganjiahuensis]|uniref:hypothetical protein n=1 Tax=Nocardiopsis ganjiahuensis TaxID=239984 RepID=UPI0003456982|nr:hypothetical protein [Nocardiopsis ganjiahuensis]